MQAELLRGGRRPRRASNREMLPSSTWVSSIPALSAACQTIYPTKPVDHQIVRRRVARVGLIDRWILSRCYLKAFFLQPQVGIAIHLDRAARSQALSFLGDRMPAKGRAVRIIPRRLGAGRTQRPEVLPKNQVSGSPSA
jgi:hypothetical protein